MTDAAKIIGDLVEAMDDYAPEPPPGRSWTIALEDARAWLKRHEVAGRREAPVSAEAPAALIDQLQDALKAYPLPGWIIWTGSILVLVILEPNATGVRPFFATLDQADPYKALIDALAHASQVFGHSVDPAVCAHEQYEVGVWTVDRSDDEFEVWHFEGKCSDCGALVAGLELRDPGNGRRFHVEVRAKK